MVRPAGSPPRSHHIGEKTPPKQVKGKRHSKEEAERKKRVRGVKPKGSK